MQRTIRVNGARQNNLKNVHLEIPRDKFVVFTGVSGSGKSSLAFNTLHAEGQLRYVESLSSYARLFLNNVDKPDVDSIEGLSPTIAIEQKTTTNNPRSTVGTVTEIYDYLRLLWARIGTPHCPSCGSEIKRQSIDEIIDQIYQWPMGTRFYILAPVVSGRRGNLQDVLSKARADGYVRIRLNGEIVNLNEEIHLDETNENFIEIVVDRLMVKKEEYQRLADSLESAYLNSKENIIIQRVDIDANYSYTQSLTCTTCNVSLTELSPRMFSFNNQQGACPICAGTGHHLKIDLDKIIPDLNISLNDGAIIANGWNNVKGNSQCKMIYSALSKIYDFKLDEPLSNVSKEAMIALLYGTDSKEIEHTQSGNLSSLSSLQSFEGVVNNLERRYRETDSDEMKKLLETYMSSHTCPDCQGNRLNSNILGVTVGNLNITEFCKLSLAEAQKFLSALELSDTKLMIAESIIYEIQARLTFLKDVGLDYLTLDRTAGTLSGGESQRVRMATQIGSGLTNMVYILDEPSIGLHQRDNERLLKALKRMKDQGNTLIVVEHDEDTIRRADWIVDVGPDAGSNGGEIVAQGTLDDIMKEKRSITGQYLSQKKFIPTPPGRRNGNGLFLSIIGAAENNLKEINVSIPLATLTCVTGVSGSGKSSLVNEILYKKLARVLNRAHTIPGKHIGINGYGHLDKVINIDQSPIGRTPRSNPATYTGLFDDVRALFSKTTEAKVRAYGPSRFSFNVRGGRCEACAGDGVMRIEMHFLPDTYVVCDICKGKRYDRETLEVLYKGKNIADILEMTADEAIIFFSNVPKIRKKVEALCRVGLGYIQLGQPSTTLSGGEAQRVKLASELLKTASGSTMYIMDEPTTGLHMSDVSQLIEIMHALVDAGNSLVVIEHNLDVIKNADYIIDLGSEGGALGGNIVCTGTPEQLANCKTSYTGQFLSKLIN